MAHKRQSVEQNVQEEQTDSAFTSALSKLVSVNRAEVQRRLATAPVEKTSRHKRYKYVPEANHGKS